METFQWTDKYRTNIGSIDKQHRGLFEKLNKLELAIYRGECKSNLRELANFFEKYIEEHFTLEETLMKQNNYPEYIEHVLQHDQFRKMFQDFVKDLDRRGGDSYLAMHIGKELRKWWENHILKTDMRYVPHLGETKE